MGEKDNGLTANGVKQTNRDRHVARLREKYPDRKFEDDEEIYGQIGADYDEYDRQIAENRKREEAFSNMFTSNPKSARLMMEWKDGKDPVASLIRIYGKDDILAAIDDPERLEAIEQANKEFAERVAKNGEYESQYEKNLPESLSTIEKWMEENGIDDESIDKAVETLSQICGDFILGKISPTTIEMVMKGLNHDADVATAAEDGEIAGRNAKIVEHLRRGKEGDGIPALNGRNGNPAPKKKSEMSVFDLAREAD